MNDKPKIKTKWKIGETINLNDPNERQKKWNNHIVFHPLMFRFFESVSSGCSGHGISFKDWLSFYGWEHIKLGTYRKTKTVEQVLREHEKSEKDAVKGLTKRENAIK
jgi:hypothetical protein